MNKKQREQKRADEQRALLTKITEDAHRDAGAGGPTTVEGQAAEAERMAKFWADLRVSEAKRLWGSNETIH